jgi:hypothetical protein
MKYLLSTLVVVAILFLASATVVVWCSWGSVRRIAADADQTIKDLDAGAKKVSQAAGDVETSLSNYQKAEAAQITEGSKILGAARVIITRTNCNINGGPGCKGLLPLSQDAVAAIADDVDKVAGTANTSIETLSAAGQNSLEASTRLLETGQERLADPRIGEIFDHLDIATLHLGNASVSFDDASGKVDHTFTYFDKKLTTPLGFWKTAGMGLFHMIPAGADVYSAYTLGTANVATQAAIKPVSRRRFHGK